jgi:hypothetical protein
MGSASVVFFVLLPSQWEKVVPQDRMRAFSLANELRQARGLALRQE